MLIPQKLINTSFFFFKKKSKNWLQWGTYNGSDSDQSVNIKILAAYNQKT